MTIASPNQSRPPLVATAPSPRSGPSQSELHPDDGVDISNLHMVCGSCSGDLHRSPRRTEKVAGQEYSVYPFACPTRGCSTVDLYVPRDPKTDAPRDLSDVTLSALELKSEGYLDPIRKERRNGCVRYHYARRDRTEAEVFVDVPNRHA
ncbi:MAG: hypothetical protein AAGN66_21060 [Acidobacteriota bacterium]